jgi:methyl-accepting chemotaxis protein
MDKTVKTHIFPEGAKSAAAQNNLTEAQEKALELVKKNAQLEEEKSKSFELQKTIEQLRVSLRQEQARTTEMAEKAVMLEARVRELSGQEARIKKTDELEARIKELTEALGKISGIASAGKAG